MMDYMKKPWSVEDTIDHLEEIRAFLAKQISKVNLDGKAESDIEELNYDFGRAIDALKENMEIKKLGSLEEVREAVGFRKARKPILSKIPYKKFGREEEITGIYCKTCGSYITNFTEAEIFGFCKTCGQAIDWSDEDD